MVRKLQLGLALTALYFCLIMFAPISHAGGLGFAPLAAIFGIGGYLIWVGSEGQRSIAPTFIMVLVFLMWAAVTSFWSPYDDTQPLPNAWKLLIAVILYGGAFLYSGRLPEKHKAYTRGLIMFAAWVCLILITIDLFADYMIAGYFYPLGDEHPVARQNSMYQNLSHSLTVLALLTPLLFSSFARLQKLGWMLMFVWMICLCGLAFKAGIFVVILACIVSSLFMLIAIKRPRLALDGAIFVSIASILLAPLVGYAMNFVSEEQKVAMPESWEHRVEMWKYTSELIAEKSFVGHGFDAVRTFDRTYTGMGYEQTIISLHPHNAGLHIWVETGTVGAVMACLILFLLRNLLKSAIMQQRSIAIPVIGFLASALVICTMTYGVWQEWWWGVLIFIGALIPMYKVNAA